MDLYFKTSFYLDTLRSHDTIVLVALHGWTSLWDITLIHRNWYNDYLQQRGDAWKMHQLSSWKWRCLKWTLFSDNAWSQWCLILCALFTVMKGCQTTICRWHMQGLKRFVSKWKPGLWNKSNSIQKHLSLRIASRIASVISWYKWCNDEWHNDKERLTFNDIIAGFFGPLDSLHRLILAPISNPHLCMNPNLICGSSLCPYYSWGPWLSDWGLCILGCHPSCSRPSINATLHDWLVDESLELYPKGFVASTSDWVKMLR